METYLQDIAAQLRSNSPTQIELSTDKAERGDLWQSSDPDVALDHLVTVFNRCGLGTGDVVMLPVHEVDHPTLTGEYIAYRKDEYGEALHYYDGEDNLDEFIEFEEATRSGLAYRLRFWDRRFDLPDDIELDLVDDRPPYRSEPITAQQPLDDEEYCDYVNDTLQFVRTELVRSHEEKLDTIISQGVKVDNSGGGKIQSAQPRVQDNEISCSVHVPPANSPGQRYNRVQNEYGVFEGNTVLLVWESNTGEETHLDGLVTAIGSSSITIDPAFGTIEFDEVNLSGVDEISLRVITKGIAEKREYEAFESITANHRDLLAGDRDISFCSPLRIKFEPFLDLNPYQERAAVDALRTDDVFCIHGPPGTGKTRTLVTIVAHAVKQGQRVLVCAHSNQAVDNIVAGESTESEIDLASLHNVVEEFDDLDVSMARIGSSRRDVNSFVGRRYFQQSNQLKGSLDGTDIIASTTNTAATLEKHDEISFDLVVIDEATQASGPATAVPFGWGSRTDDEEEFPRPYGLRTVLAGDHKQLPPFVSDPEMRDQELHTSLFEHLLNLYGDDLAQTLHRQYRMHEDIAEFASQEFYDGILEHGEANRAETIDGLTPLLGIDDSGDEQQDDHSYYNPTEAQYVVAQVNKAFEHGTTPSDIGVITGYSAQRDYIRSQIRTELGDDIGEGVDVETIDKFQGGQREVIIVSFVRSNASKDSGFLESPRDEGRKRLNVAFTRAKKRLVVIGDWDTLSNTATFRDEESSCADTFSRLREYLIEKDVLVSR